MNRLPSSHLEQGNQGVYCDMNHQLNHNFRVDQGHSHMHQDNQPQLRMDAVRRSSLQNVTADYGHPSYSNSGDGSNNSCRHIYDHYTLQQQQQASNTSQQMYIQSQLNEPAVSQYQVPGHCHENIPYDSRASYGINIHQMQQEPMQTTSQLYNSVPLIRAAPQVHHHHHLQQHHHKPQQQQQHYQYNGCIVTLQQQNDQLHHQQEDYHLNQMPEHPRAQQPTILDGAEAEYNGGEIIDQNHVYYQQEQMDLLPTIKQQQQLQQQQHQLHLRQQNMSIDTGPLSMGVSDTTRVWAIQPTMQIATYETQMRETATMSQALQHPESRTNLVDLPQTLPQQQQMSQLVSRSKSDLAAPVVYNSNNFESQRKISLHQNQRPSSTISYLSHNNSNNSNTNNNRPNQQEIASSICDEPNPIPPATSTTKRHQDDFVDMRSCGNVSQDWLDTICPHLIEHMNQFGICVIDNFLGNSKGELVLKEVQQLYSSGQYTRGRLVSSKLNSRPSAASVMGSDEVNSAAAAIRNDRVIWIDGYEDGCSEINNLIQTLCSVITNSSRLSLYSNNGLDKLVINKRTKAHVACYPGNGTRYIKHVDNPNNDGRVITSIYYLNKDWNTKRDGGLLRMFPVGMNEVANIEPLFDRVLFFWSDRRNPHEVLPAYRDRFAITVWYIGENRT